MDANKNSLSVLFCTLSAKYIHASLAPWYLVAGIEQYCTSDISTEVFEISINAELQDIIQGIEKSNCDVVAFGCYIWNIEKTKLIIADLKTYLPNVIIIIGGPEVSFCSENVFTQIPKADYLVCGEGEHPVAKLIDAISENPLAPNISDIPGVYKNSDATELQCSAYVGTLDPPSPYSQKYLSHLGGRIAYLESSRGCPFSCSFCLSGASGGVRFFELERVKRDILTLSTSGSRTIKFVDRTFNCDRRRALDIIKFIIENHGCSIPKSVRFHFEIAGDLLDSETLSVLGSAPAGLFQLEIGLQSFHTPTLDAIHRSTDVKLLTDNIKTLLKPQNLHLHIDLIAGLPYEGFSEFRDSFNTAFSLRPHMLQLGFLKLLHGSELRENAEKYGIVFCKTAPYEVIRTDYITEDELRRLAMLEDALERIYNSGRFSGTLDYLLEATAMSAFDLLLSIGEYLSNKVAKISLDDFTDLFFNYCTSLTAVDSSKLRDIMVCDRLSTNNTGRLPNCLKQQNKIVGQVAKKLDNLYPRKSVRAVAYLKTFENKIVWVDYDNSPHPVTGKYVLNFKQECEFPI